MKRNAFLSALTVVFFFCAAFASTGAGTPTAAKDVFYTATFNLIGAKSVWTNVFQYQDRLLQLKSIRLAIEIGSKVLAEKVFKKGDTLPSTFQLSAAADPKNKYYSAGAYMEWADGSTPAMLKAGFAGKYTLTVRFVEKAQVKVMDVQFR